MLAIHSRANDSECARADLLQHDMIRKTTRNS